MNGHEAEALDKRGINELLASAGLVAFLLVFIVAMRSLLSEMAADIGVWMEFFDVYLWSGFLIPLAALTHGLYLIRSARASRTVR
jgi:uncharacterized membrane protein YphA (DoxX/SURF4 family)